MSTITEANKYTTRDDITFAAVGIKPHRSGAVRIPDNLTAWKLTAIDNGFSWLCLSDSRRTYRMDVDTARRFCTTILQTINDNSTK